MKEERVVGEGPEGLERVIERNLERSLDILRQGAYNPHYSLDLREQFEIFCESIELVWKDTMRERVVGSIRARQHPLFWEKFGRSAARAAQSRIVYTLEDEGNPERFAVLVSQEYLETRTGPQFFYFLLADHFGHLTSNVREKRSVKEYDKSLLRNVDYLQWLRELREEAGMLHIHPDTLLRRGFDLVMYEGKYCYGSILTARVFENVRSKIMAVHLLIHVSMSENSCSFLDAINICREKFKRLGRESATAISCLDYASALGWPDVEHVCVSGKLEDFLGLGNTVLGENENADRVGRLVEIMQIDWVK